MLYVFRVNIANRIVDAEWFETKIIYVASDPNYRIFKVAMRDKFQKSPFNHIIETY